MVWLSSHNRKTPKPATQYGQINDEELAQKNLAARYNTGMASDTNIYAYERNHTFEHYADRLEGNRDGLILVVFTEAPSDAARNALSKSFAAIGFGHDACTFALLEGLLPDEVFTLVEGVDPVALVACDAKAAGLYGQAVRQEFPVMQRTRVFGREARAFPRLNAMLETEADRQAVWHLLKTMA